MERQPSASDRAVEMPNIDVETPCFVIFERNVIHNLERTIAHCGGVERLMPHVKTHRAPWIVKLLRDHGVDAFKTATVAEAEMVAESGGRLITWAYPSVNPANIRRFVECARRHPDASFVGMVDCMAGIEAWKTALEGGADNVRLRVDLDPGLGRTGAPMSDGALPLARKLDALGLFCGFHVYDGHVGGEREARAEQVAREAESVMTLQEKLQGEGIEGDVVAGGSYTFDLWPKDVARFVSPGSWTFSSAQHDIELDDLGWKPAAFVLSTVVSKHEGTATLDAGAKAISPDKPLAERFRWETPIRLMNEEHSVVESDDLAVGERVYLLPRHACTTAYLYDRALVKTADGQWEMRAQLGGAR